MDELDKILKEIMSSKHQADNPAEGKDCLSEESFAGYLENRLDPLQKENVEKHLAKCEICFQKNILFSNVMKELQSTKQKDVPTEVTEKAKMLVRGQSSKDIIEVVLQFGKDIISVIRDTAGICTILETPALNFRSSGVDMDLMPTDTSNVLCDKSSLSFSSDSDETKGTYIAKLSKVFEDIKADITIEKTGTAECGIDTNISDPLSGATMDDIRINLLADEKEIASYLTVNGQVSFQDLKFDNYILKIYKGKNQIGSVLLKLSSV